MIGLPPGDLILVCRSPASNSRELPGDWLTARIWAPRLLDVHGLRPRPSRGGWRVARPGRKRSSLGGVRPPDRQGAMCMPSLPVSRRAAGLTPDVRMLRAPRGHPCRCFPTCVVNLRASCCKAMGASVTRAVRNFNLENRAEREISKLKPSTAPRHPSTKSLLLEHLSREWCGAPALGGRAREGDIERSLDPQASWFPRLWPVPSLTLCHLCLATSFLRVSPQTDAEPGLGFDLH
jgi:hypothetical protein